MAQSRWQKATLVWGSASLMLACQTGGAGRPVPTPLPVPVERLPEAREQLRELGRKQPYDANPGASDRAILEEGAEVTIEPQDGAFRLSRAQLGEGRIVARFVNNSDKPVKRYALPARGTSYWVVYQVKGEWLSAIIADSRDRELDRFNIRTRLHQPTRSWLQSISQWQLAGVLGNGAPGGGPFPTIAAGKISSWTTCERFGCCFLDPDDPPPQ